MYTSNMDLTNQNPKERGLSRWGRGLHLGPRDSDCSHPFTMVCNQYINTYTVIKTLQPYSFSSLLAMINIKKSMQQNTELSVLKKTENLLIGFSRPAPNFLSHNLRFCSVIDWGEGNAYTWPPECRFTNSSWGSGGREPKYAFKIPLPTGVFLLQEGRIEYGNYSFCDKEIIIIIYRAVNFNY